MRAYCRLYLAVGLLALGSCKKVTEAVVSPPVVTTFTNPLLAVGPDPWVLQKNGVYYYMHTTGRNLALWKTNKMSELSSAVSRVIWTPPATGANSHDIWAPEIHFLDGKWY